jgi:hypothetical protein
MVNLYNKTEDKMQSKVTKLSEYVNSDSYDKYLASLPELHKKYMNVDCSIQALNKELINQYGKNGYDLQKDESFNIWDAYSYLKKYVGILDIQFEQPEFDKRIKNIQDVLNV